MEMPSRSSGRVGPWAVRLSATILLAGVLLVWVVWSRRPAPEPEPTPASYVILGPVEEVTAVAETSPVPSDGDSADDPAIWTHPADPSLSLIIGTDKRGGLAVYDLAGKEIQFRADGEINNVDLRDGFPLAGEPVPLVIAGNLSTNTLGVYRIDPDRRALEDVSNDPIQPGIKIYGTCMYRSASSGKVYVFLTSTRGQVQQWELFDDGAGRVVGRLARSLTVGSKSEGCVADDDLGTVYVSEEAVGIWRYGAEPDAGEDRSLVDRVGEGHLVPDVEGLAIASTGAGRGFLIASSQGSDTFAMYRREDGNEFVKTFKVVDGDTDPVTHTDGIDVTTTPLGPVFPDGLFVAQDGANDGGNLNFKLVPWADIVPEAASSPGPSGDARVAFRRLVPG